MKPYTKVSKYSDISYERETLISYCDAEKTASCYTRNFSMMERLRTLAKERPEDVKLVQDSDFCVEAILPKKWVKIRPSRILTPEQKLKAVERGKRIYEIQRMKKEAKSEVNENKQ